MCIYPFTFLTFTFTFLYLHFFYNRLQQLQERVSTTLTTSSNHYRGSFFFFSKLILDIITQFTFFNYKFNKTNCRENVEEIYKHTGEIVHLSVEHERGTNSDPVKLEVSPPPSPRLMLTPCSLSASPLSDTTILIEQPEPESPDEPTPSTCDDPEAPSPPLAEPDFPAGDPC